MNRISLRWFLVPSSYGLAAWVALLLTVGFTRVNIGFDAWLVLAYVPFCFAISNFFNRLVYEKRNFDLSVPLRREDHVLFVFSSLVGAYGLFVYVWDFSSVLGGANLLLSTFFEAPLEIRALAQEISSFGFQLSYLSWISFFYCILFLASGLLQRRFHKVFVGGMALAIFFLNLLFIDRTRPITLFMIAALVILALKARATNKISRNIGAMVLVPLLMFLAHAIFTGKYNSDDGVIGSLVRYVYGGFGYFSSLLYEVNPRYEVTRTFLPASKLLESFGWLNNVPSQILSFRDVPFTTNVGTFLEPLLSDGGGVFVIIGAPLIIFCIDYFALKAISSGGAIGIFLWANLVFVALISFFVPKYNSTYIYLFLILYALMQLKRFHLRH